MTIAFEGGCLCGAVRYRSTAPQQFGGNCHCTDCRRTSATGHASHMVLPKDALTVTGALTFFDAPADSGNIVSRGFCPTCGSQIVSKNSAMPDLAFIRASSLDDMENFTPQMTVYAGRAPSWDRPLPDIPQFDGMPPQMPAEVATE